MNVIIEWLNRAGGQWAPWDSAWLLQSSVVIVVLWALDLLLRRRARAVIRYGLSLLILLKLILPPSLAFPTGIGYWLAGPRAARVPVNLPSTTKVAYADALAQSAAPTLSVSGGQATLRTEGSVFLAMALGSAGLFAVFFTRARAASRLLVEAESASDRWHELLRECRDQISMKATVEVKITDRLMSPAVCGLWRPVILISRKLAEQLSEKQLRAVILHELMHLKRGDMWVNYFQTLLQIIYWWHPLLWLGNGHIRRVREQAVDEQVMAALEEEQAIYPDTLLAVARYCLVRPVVSLGLTGMVESRNALRLRIERLVHLPAPRHTKLGIAGLASIATLGAVLLPMAEGQPRTGAVDAVSNKPAGEPAANRAQTAASQLQLMFEAKFLEMPVDGYNQLKLGQPVATTNGFHIWLLSDEQMKALIETAKKQRGTDTLSAPKITTLERRNAQVTVEDMVNVVTSPGHTNKMPFGISLNIDNPEFSSDRHFFSATLTSRVKEFLGYDKTPTGSAPRMRDRSMAYAARIPQGSTIVLGGAERERIIVGATGKPANVPSGKRLLVCVTPSLITPEGTLYRAP